MHYLFRSLVRIDSKKADAVSRKTLIDEIRKSAKDATEMYNYGHQLYDWREEDTAGGWVEQYPENVILGSENPSKLIKELLNQQQREKTLLESLLDQIDETGEKSLRAIVKDSLANDVLGLAYDLSMLGHLLAGYVSSDNAFLAEGGAGCVSNDLLQQVKANPGEWAMVFFDHHI